MTTATATAPMQFRTDSASLLANPPGHNRPMPQTLKRRTGDLIQIYRRRPTGWMPRGDVRRLELAAEIRAGRNDWRTTKQALLDRFTASLMARGVIDEPEQASSGATGEKLSFRIRKIAR